MLKKHILRNPARINSEVCVIIFLKAGTFDLKKVVPTFQGKTNQDLKYKKIQRFL